MFSSDVQSPRLVLILGGARSGKSTFAERLATNSGRSVAFIATAMPGDDEMRERIAHHQSTRPANWLTIEEPFELADAVQRASEQADVLLLDCVTLWLGNLIGKMSTGDDDTVAFQAALTDVALANIEQLLMVVASLSDSKTLLIVSNEVGLGIVPAYALGRVYRDTLGIVNQRLAQSANRVYLMVAGLAVDIKQLNKDARL